ncbi:thymidine phosphorylase [bacterium]|nr:thymidine phosphorylase [bacterium]
MNVPELIYKKRQGGELTREEIEFLIRGYVSGDVPEYQISAFLMAVFFKSMTPEEAAALTRVMMTSGDTFDLSSIPGIKTDKHSTGGVGDKVSLILAPLVAAAGVVDPMVSGRGLGHSGGTLDKLDAIPGYRWALSEAEFKAQLDKIGCAIIGQTENFVPADKRLYSLRDVTATVESIPLICGSILSKKAASGADALVMDVKCGSGAFMDTFEKASALARQLVAIGTALGMKMSAMITQMSQPLGDMVGNSLEILETLDLLEGKGPADSRECTLRLGADMLVHAGKAADSDAAYATLVKLLDDGSAMAKFEEWITAQGGDANIIRDRSLLPQVKTTETYKASRSGVIQSMDTRKIGVAGNTLGAGRMKTTDTVDLAVGLHVHRKVGEKVSAGDEIMTIYHRDEKGLNECKRLLDEAIVIGDEPTKPLELILDRIWEA